MERQAAYAVSNGSCSGAVYFQKWRDKHYAALFLSFERGEHTLFDGRPAYPSVDELDSVGLGFALKGDFVGST
jgi:hypothetical protein